MKNIKFLFLLVATLFVGAFTSCQQEEDWAPGQPDSELSVYFPVDVNVAEFASVDNDDTVEIDETTTAVFPVYRPIAGEKMTVEIRSRIVNPDALVYRKTDSNGKILYEVNAAEAFTIAESITFDADETLTYLQIDLNEKVESLSVGSLFEIEIMVKDSAHHGSYGLYRKTLSVGIPETWKDLGEDYKDADLKRGTYRDDFIAPLYAQPAGNVVSIVIEESESRKGVLRMKNVFSQDNVVAIIGGIPSDMSFANGDTYILIDARDPESVYIPFQPTGVGIAGYMDNIGIASGASIGVENAVLENGIINFAANTVGLLDYNTGTGMYANQSGLMRITLPGVYIPDYSIGVSYVGVDDDQALFNFVLGRDVAEYRFVVVEGNQPTGEEVKTGTGLNQKWEIVLNEAIEAMINNDVYDVCSPASQTEWRVSLPNAAVYTIFAVAYNSNGEPIYTDVHEYDNIARTHFYFRTEGSEDAIPDIHPETLTLRLDTVAAIMGEHFAESYPGYNILLLEMVSAEDYMDYVVGLKLYYDTTANIEQAKADGVTMDTLFASDQAEDITDRIVDIKQGNGMMLLKDLISDTSYTAIIEVSSIYGKKHYYDATGSTEKQM